MAEKKKASPWSEQEVQDTIASYFAMLAKEATEEKYNKAQYRRELKEKLNDRSEGSIEMKHMNISAILKDMGWPYINGYKPLPNYQKSLKEAVIAQSSTVAEIAELFLTAK